VLEVASHSGGTTVLGADDSARRPPYGAPRNAVQPNQGDPMKRLVTLTAALLVCIAAPIALASGGPGKFTTTLAGKSAKTEHGKLDGTWTIGLSSPTSGKVKLTWNGERSGGGTYVISGSTITLTPKKGGQCTGKGKYKFKLSGDKLKFTVIKDSCTVRRDVLTYGAWTKTG
jgi:hypothetical protein